MNIIQEITKKYSGEYSEDPTKSFSGPTGKYIYQPKKGIIECDGTKISINLNEVGGAMYGTEPFRIILHLDRTYDTEFSISPKNSWNKFLDFILPKRTDFIPVPIRKQFLFGGNKDIIEDLVTDKYFAESITNETIFIGTGNKPTGRIILTPSYGIKDIDQFEKFVSILKTIESKMKNGTLEQCN